MELKEYIQSVITQIGEAINECNEVNGEQCNVVNPIFKNFKIIDGDKYVMPSPDSYVKVTDVDFEVFLSATNNSEADGRVGVSVLGFGRSMQNEHTIANKVKFTIPVLFPSKDKSSTLNE